METLVAGYEIIEQKPGIEGMYEAAEIPGRICYHSMDKKTDDSAKPFCEKLMSSDHGAPLEHGTVYLKYTDINSGVHPLMKYSFNQYSIVHTEHDESTMTQYVTTNLRVLFEHGWLDDLQYWCEPTEHHEKRHMVRFTIDRFTGEEFLRHRKASFNRESTRYVCFTKEKFGGGSIKFIIPVWLLDNNGKIPEDIEKSVKSFDGSYLEKCSEFLKQEEYGSDFKWRDFDYWLFSLKTSEYCYNKLVNDFHWQAQQARTVLPCAINSPLIMTQFDSDFDHFFRLRALGTTGMPHPQAVELAYPLMVDFLKRGYTTKEKLLEPLSGEKYELAKQKLDLI